MHRDRDFDLQEAFPWNEAALTQDLDLETLFHAMAGEDEFLWEVVRRTLLNGMRNDADTVLYRQEIVKDCLQNPKAITDLYDLAVETIERTRKNGWGISSHYASSMLYSSTDLLEMLVGMLRRLRGIAEAQRGRFQSQGFTALFSTVEKELTDEYLTSMQDHLAVSKFRKGVLLSAELGTSNESTGFVLRKLPEKKQKLLERIFSKGPPAYTFHLPERDEAGARIVSNMRHRGISRVAVTLAESADHVLSFFKVLRTELAFYIGCIHLHERLASKQTPTCFPTPVLPGERRLCFQGLRDVCLSLRTEGRVVSNTTDANRKNLVIVTGANQGGKSIFMRSIGVSQMMMQCGMFVGAEAYEAELCPSLFTHYKREEDATMESGKFDEELARMSKIADHIGPNSLVLFNESFAATNEREGSEIARQIVCALLEKRVKIFYVTHLYEFARGFFDRKTGDVLFLRAERQPDGTRTFRLIEGEPLETSYGEDLYRKIFAVNGQPQDRVASEDTVDSIADEQRD